MVDTLSKISIANWNEIVMNGVSDQIYDLSRFINLHYFIICLVTVMFNQGEGCEEDYEIGNSDLEARDEWRKDGSDNLRVHLEYRWRTSFQQWWNQQKRSRSY